MKEELLRQYARLIASTGGHVVKGDEVWIEAGLDQPEFISMLVLNTKVLLVVGPKTKAVMFFLVELQKQRIMVLAQMLLSCFLIGTT